MNTFLNYFFALFFLVAASLNLHGQPKDVKMVPSAKNAEKIVTTEGLKRDIEYMTDTSFGGRSLGARGAAETAFWIARRFNDAGLRTFSGSWSQSFPVEGGVGHNIIGFLPGSRNGAKETYLIVCAHYDNHASADGKVLPGADSNASGVVAMLKMADMFAEMKSLGRVYGSNVIFIATDCYDKNSAGAENFARLLEEGQIKDPLNQKPITVHQIKGTVVLDILGSSIEPIHKGRKDYLIMLGNPGDRDYLTRMNSSSGMSLDLGFDYYGSRNFTDMFRCRVGDQKIFWQHGLPCTLFTSGITFKTNKPEDDAESLNYDVFRQRIILIFHWLTKVL